MYQPDNKNWGKGRRHHLLDTLEKWTDQIDPHEYQIETADVEGWYTDVFSVWNMKNECIWFMGNVPMSKVTKIPDDGFEIKFLVDGHQIKRQSVARALINPISSWSLGVKASKHEYGLRLTNNRGITGTYSGQKISIVKGETLVWHPRSIVDGHAINERIYIKEHQGTIDAPLKELCPKRNHVNEYHDYACWFSFKEIAYQSCRYCNNLWIREGKYPYKRLEHPPWNLMRKIKEGVIQSAFLLHLPNAEIFWDPSYSTWYFESFNQNSKHINSTTNPKDIPSYPQEQPDKILDTLKEISDAAHPTY